MYIYQIYRCTHTHKDYQSAIKMYIALTKHKPNNVYCLQIKSTKNIYIALARPCQNNVYRAYMYSLEIKSSTTTTTTTTNKNISLTSKLPFSETKLK